MSSIAIIGAGFAGLATAYHLINLHPTLQITLYDPLGAGGGASGVASGLLHAHMGAKAKKHLLGSQAIASTMKLIEAAQRFTSTPIILSTGMIRPARSQEQASFFQQTLSQENEISLEWRDAQKIQQEYPWLECYGGLFLPNAVSINSSAYIQGLLSLLLASGRVRLIHEKITTIGSIYSLYHAIVVTAGSGTLQIDATSHLPLSLTKGQTIELPWSPQIEPLTYSLNADKYLLMLNRHQCLLGATYEHTNDETPDLQEAIKQLTPSLKYLAPHLTDQISQGILRCGMRCYAPEKNNAYVQRVQEHLWTLTGLGSRGLLLHSYLAQKIAHEIITTI